MKKVFKIEVDCAHCANKMEECASKVKGVRSAAVSFMTLKMTVVLLSSRYRREIKIQRNGGLK